MVPDGVAFADGGTDGAGLEDLLGTEKADVAGALEPRQREFAAGRLRAREALRQLGLADVSIPVGADRAPVWPPSTVGSITHAEGYCAAAAARQRAFKTIGIDAEADRPLPEEVRDDVLTLRERELLPGDGQNWDVATFSAKEALFKAWSPLTGAWLGFAEAEIEFHVPRGLFTASLAPPAAATAAKSGFPARLSGRFAFRRGLVLTSICLAQGETR